MTDDSRPFFGEREEVLSAPEWRNTNDHLRRGTPAERYEWRLAEGLCCHRSGTVYCTGSIEPETGYCSLCGQVSKPLVSAANDAAQSPNADWLPTLPLALRIDEFAPANVDDEAA
jgi:hypothetical protein